MSGAARHIKVLVIDDSAVVRKLLGSMLATDPEIEVVGTAHDAYIAREKIKRLKPDVLTLDVEMPRMDGLTFLGNLMRLHPLPVVMVSTLTAKGADVTLDALELGAVDFVCKPRLDLSHTFEDYAGEVIAKVKQAARARVHQRQAGRAAVPTVLPPLAQGQDRSHGLDEVFPKGAARRWRGSDQLIAIGASTGGTEAIREVLQRFPLDVPGIVVAQHIPAGFSKAFADRLNAHCAITVCQASDGDPILPGHAYVAPGDRHLLVVRDGARWRCRLSDELPVNRHKPSVDALFRSVAQSAGPSAVGVLLTGMGKDGALGLKDILEAGGRTLAQDEASSVVWGMPGAAVQLGACRETVPLPRISERILELIVQAREAA